MRKLFGLVVLVGVVVLVVSSSAGAFEKEPKGRAHTKESAPESISTP